MRRIVLLVWVMVVAASSSLWGAEQQDTPVGKPAGSGVIVHSDGYVLTAEHVIADAQD
jgi:S1-C subfamily serine protease